METECKETVRKLRGLEIYKKIPRGTKYKGQVKSKLNKKELCDFIAKLTISKSPYISKRSIKSEKRIPLESLFKNKCFDYTNCLIKTKTEDGLDYMIIPKRTIFFHGTKSDFPDDIIPRIPTFYGTMKVASIYAFKGKQRGERGKIITVEVTKDIKVLLITPESLKKLSNIEDFPLEAFEYAFSFGKEELHRRSHPLYDKFLTSWICNQGFDGWMGYRLKGFHDEVILCKEGFVKRYPIEIRFDERIPHCGIITINGEFYSVLRSEEDLGGISFSSSGKEISEPRTPKNPNKDKYILYLNEKGYENFPECQRENIPWKHKNPFI